MRGGHSLRGRLLGAMLAVFALGLAASLISYRFEVHNLVEDLHARTIQAQARELLSTLQVQEDGRISFELPADWQKVYDDPSQQFAYTLYDRGHQPIAQSPNLNAPLPYVGLPSSQPYSRIDFSGVGSHQRAILAARAPGGDVLVVARGDLTRDTLVDSLFEEDSEHLLVLVPFALAALALIWGISGWSLRPVARASRDAATVGPTTPGMRIASEGLPREIRPLVEAVNGALDRLTQAYAAERRLTADAAHELRTPLAVLALRLQRAQLSGIVDWPAVERELGQMRRLVDQLMDLARKEALSRQRNVIDLPVLNLSRVVREAAAMTVPLVEAQGRSLHVDVPDLVPVRGRADDLRDMVRNLLDNALIHGRGAVAVRVHETVEPSQPRLTIEVSDEGDGVPIGQEEKVFERFRKLDANAPGSGLGLAIVRQVAHSHGGEVRFLSGRGCIVVSLPRLSDVAPVPERTTSHR